MISQRIRVEFAKGDEVKHISHLDLMRAWHRALRRANIPLGYSAGYTARPRLSLASPLSVGFTGAAELLDVYLRRRMAPFTFLRTIAAQLPKGLEARTAEEVPLSLPSLQSLVRAADYAIAGETEKPQADLEEAIAALLARSHLPWEHEREGETRRYDLRSLVLDLRLIGCVEGKFALALRLRAGSEGTGRPEQVLAALGFPDAWTSIQRTRIVLGEET
ncbi:MAG: DUF2344 domain-containing protein [Chloroflexi bacterium]|nr:DUF2344 domain-containing protein [Chloroflexota bacterium]